MEALCEEDVRSSLGAADRTGGNAQVGSDGLSPRIKGSGIGFALAQPAPTEAHMQHMCANLGGNTKSFVLIGTGDFFYAHIP